MRDPIKWLEDTAEELHRRQHLSVALIDDYKYLMTVVSGLREVAASIAPGEDQETDGGPRFKVGAENCPEVLLESVEDTVPAGGEMPIEQPRYVYAVGSGERKLIVDQIFLTEIEAVECCDQKSDGCFWVVAKVPLGGVWLDWEFVHRHVSEKT